MEKPKQTISELFAVKSPLTYTIKHVEIPHHVQVLGMEIEVENCKNLEFYQEKLPEREWTITNDGSLRGQAYEFISKPMNTCSLIESLNRFYSWNKFTEANFTDRCSIHVHANVTDFTVDELSSLALYYQTIEQVLFEFVGGSRDTNLYCIPWTQCLMNHKLINGLYSEGYGTLKTWQKYTALNLLPILKQGTVEFRHMHGTADTTKIFTWLEIISHLMYKSKNTSLEEVLAEVTSLNDSSQYMNYFNKLLNGALPYNDKYRIALQDGVIHAKYSLIGFDASKREVRVPKIVKEEEVGLLRRGVAGRFQIQPDENGNNRMVDTVTGAPVLANDPAAIYATTAAAIGLTTADPGTGPRWDGGRWDTTVDPFDGPAVRPAPPRPTPRHRTVAPVAPADPIARLVQRQREIEQAEAQVRVNAAHGRLAEAAARAERQRTGGF